jgi:hypothetical protein
MCNQKTSWYMYLSITGSGLRCWGSWTSCYSPHPANRRRAQVRNLVGRIRDKIIGGIPERDEGYFCYKRQRSISSMLKRQSPPMCFLPASRKSFDQR